MAVTARLDLDPDPDVPDALIVSVVAEIDGVRQRLIVDTGGASSSLAEGELSRMLAPAPSGSDDGRGVFGLPRRAERVVAEAMMIGGLRIVRPRFDVEPLAVAPSLLGLDVLGEHRLDFLFSDGVLEFDGETAVDRRRNLVRSSRRHPYVEVGWGEVEVDAIWDSGASISIVDREFARRHGQLFRPAGDSRGIDSGGIESSVEMVVMDALSVGGRAFGPSIAGVAGIRGIQRPGDPSFDLILGMPVLRHAHWALDLVEGWWGFR